MKTETTIDADTGAIVLTPPQDATPSTLNLISEGFGQFYDRANALRETAMAIRVTSPDDKEAIAAAREHRLALRTIRTGADKTRKNMKEDSLRLGRAIDGAYNMLEHAIKPLETHLEDQEKIAERMETERIQERREDRMKRLLEADPDHMPTVDVASYLDADFERVLEDVRTLREVRQERQRREELERIERDRKEAEERERIRLENEKLKAEAAAREKELAAERAAVAEAQRKAAAELAAEREKAAAQARAEAAAREKAEAETARLRAEAARKEQEAAAAAAKAEADRAAAAKKAARAPDKTKMLAFAAEVRALSVPTGTTDEGKAVATEIAAKVASFAKWIETQASTL